MTKPETTLAIPVKEKPYGLYEVALSSTRISEMKKSDACKEFNGIISKVYFDCGQKVEKEDLISLCTNLYTEIETYFKFLRIDEVKVAFSKGVRNEYGEYFGINIKTFNQWLKGYQFDENRKSALLRLEASKNEPIKPIMTESEAYDLWKKTILKQFAHFKETGQLVVEFPSHLFERLESIGLIKLTDEQKKPIYEQAKVKIEEAKKFVRIDPKKNMIARNEATAFLNRMKTNQLTKFDKQEIKSEARRIALKQYFESITELKL